MRTFAERTRPDRGGSTLRLVALLAILAVIGALVWYTGTRMRELSRELAASEKRAAEVNERLRQYSRELELAIERARQARQRASQAEQQAEQADEARRQAEQQAEQAAAQKEAALRQANLARAETQKTRQELEEIRRRREAELDRMQQALNRIAPTRRTPSGMVVTLSSDHLRFDFDKAVIRPEDKETLSRIAGVLLASEGYRLFIDGHTDDIGTDEYNQALSVRRAKAVRDYLVKAGIPPEVITIHGFGKKQPLVKAKTREARAKNRRVEIGIVDTIIHYQKTVAR